MMYSWKTILRSSIPLLTLTIFIEIMAGQLLQGNQDMFILLPIFLITLPVINGVGGNVGSILGSRLASGLHVGYIQLDINNKYIQMNVFTAVCIGLLTYGILAILIYVIALFTGIQMDIGLTQFVTIVILAGGLLIFIISIVSVFTAFISFKRGLDPDNIVSPVVTTVSDTLGILFLILLIGAI